MINKYLQKSSNTAIFATHDRFVSKYGSYEGVVVKKKDKHFHSFCLELEVLRSGVAVFFATSAIDFLAKGTSNDMWKK